MAVKSGSIVESWLDRFRRFMARGRYSRWAMKGYLPVARAFLRFLEVRGVDPAAARPSHVHSYLRIRRARYRGRRGGDRPDAGLWRRHYTSPIHLLLRMAQRQWPPPSEISSRVTSYRLSLQRRHRNRGTISAYGIVARRFFGFLDRRGVALEQVQPTDVSAYLKQELAVYRRRHGRDPKYYVGWRCSLTRTLRDLLRKAQGQWPPPPEDPWFERFRVHMNVAGRKPRWRRYYMYAVGRFLAHLRAERIPIETVGPTHVEAYRRIKLAEYRARHHRPPRDRRQWERDAMMPIHWLLRLVHGHWPPPSPPDPLLERFRAPLLSGRYSPWTRDTMDRVARQFLAYARDRDISPEQVQPAQVESFLQARLECYRRHHGHEPPHPQGWRYRYTGPIGRLLRLAQGHWPPLPPPATSPRDRFCLELRDGFRRWLLEVRGLSELSFIKDWDTAGRFLEWLGERASVETLRQLSPPALDAFLAWRTAGLRRATRCGVCQGLRSFLRYLRAAGVIDHDLASSVGSPSRYWNEAIPSAFTDSQVKTILASTRKDRSPVGRRDYAILLLLATYGLRAGEARRLRLEDIDWRRERFRITQSKTGRSSHLPLTTTVGEAVLDYLRHGRPKSEHREVFLRTKAPYLPFSSGSGLASIVRRRLRRAGLTASGKHGAHAFRYARAVGLLRAAVPLKTISDLLGHSASSSTEIYLKLDTDELRDVALEVPEEATP